ncbi:hypothetical protein EK904_011308 [Melospiza melodia maxima]|nr:hypothetical protein EK904_011308 [Melospiza melodia maxima]
MQNSRALFGSPCEQTAHCYPALTQGCRSLGAFQVFLMHRRQTQSLEMPDLKTLWLQDMISFQKYQLLTMSTEFQDAHLAEVKPLVEKEEAITRLLPDFDVQAIHQDSASSVAQQNLVLQVLVWQLQR